MSIKDRVFRRMIKKAGKKMLDDSDKYYDKLGEFIEGLNEKDQVVFGYLYIVKILSDFDEEERKKILESIQETDWEKIK